MIGAIAIIAWGTVASCILFGILKLCGKLRVSEEDELRGKRTRCIILLNIKYGHSVNVAWNQTL